MSTQGSPNYINDKNALNNSQAQYDNYAREQTSARENYIASNSALTTARSAKTSAQNQLNKYKNYNLNKSNKEIKQSKKSNNKFKNLNQNQFKKQSKNKKKDYSDKYKNFKAYNKAKSKSQKHLNSLNNQKNNYLKAQSGFEGASKQYNTASNNQNISSQKYSQANSNFNDHSSAHSQMKATYNQNWGETDKNLNTQKNHGHNTWQDSVNGNQEYAAFNANTSNTSYGVTGKDYEYSTNMGNNDYRQSFDSDESRVKAVNSAVKNYGGILPYGGEAKDYEISANGLLIPKGTNYSYADRSMVGKDGYKSDVSTNSSTRVTGSGWNRQNTTTTTSMTTRAKKYNEENEAMKNFRSVHTQQDWNNIQSYNTSANAGQVRGDSDFSNLARYQNAFYNKDIKNEKAQTQVQSRSNLNPAQRGGDTWANDDKGSSYYSSSSYSGYRPPSGMW
jgi:hypothetical protein